MSSRIIVDTADISNNAVTTAKIADSSVSTAKIANSNVTSSKLATGSGEDSWVAGRVVNTHTSGPAIGSFIFARHIATGYSYGATAAGSNLQYAGVGASTFEFSGSPGSGTWRCLGYTASSFQATLWIRIS